MLSKLIIGSALLSGAVKGLKPVPPTPPEGVGIWWCPDCNRWQAWQDDDNPSVVCFYHKKAKPMKAHYYTYGGTL
jgi:hypothetical protein